jgi:hypothetical protein
MSSGQRVALRQLVPNATEPRYAVTGQNGHAPDVPASGYVSRERYRAMLERAADAIELLNALALFQGPGVVDTVRWFDDLVNAIDQRLGQLEKRLDEAKIPEAIIPDDECERYFTLPMLSQVGQ